MLITPKRSYHWVDNGIDWTVAEWPNAQDNGLRYTVSVKIPGCSQSLDVDNIPEAIIRALLDHGHSTQNRSNA